MLLQSLLRPVLTPLMRGMFDAPIASSAAWSPLALWPDGIATPGMWISPRDLTSQWADYTGTTPVATPGTVADSANPVGLALDIRAGATVLTDPGNHMLQSTSAARPLLSARVNLLQYTEDFTNGYWLNSGTTVTLNYGTAPDGSQTSQRLVFSGADKYLLKLSILPSPQQSAASIYVKGPVGETLLLENNISQGSNLITLTGGWQRFSRNYAAGDAFLIGTYAGSTARDVEVWHPQFQLGLTATDYQPILTDGSSYSSTGFPIAQKYDGVDDGMATAAFAAGTLIDGMDCLIPVRRDSAASCVAGLYNGVADATKFFGMAESASGSGCVGSGAGTPTVWVDNTQLTGGTAVTRGTLHTALTVGDWHILEFRNLDLSTWTLPDSGFTQATFSPALEATSCCTPAPPAPKTRTPRDSGWPTTTE
ncbi:MAG: hypothetical protein IPH15_15765 [Comamonadaceae bacterium]|nr:hypothetical protein [Comamonadaceae bacterium]